MFGFGVAANYRALSHLLFVADVVGRAGAMCVGSGANDTAPTLREMHTTVNWCWATIAVAIMVAHCLCHF